MTSSEEYKLKMEKPVDPETFEKIAEKLLSQIETDIVYNATLDEIAKEEGRMDEVIETDVPGLPSLQTSDALSDILTETPKTQDLSENITDVLEPLDVNEGFEKPATTLLELTDQVIRAKMMNRKYIEASRGVISHFCRNKYPDDHYFHYQNVMVIEHGKVENVKAKLSENAFNGAYS